MIADIPDGWIDELKRFLGEVPRTIDEWTRC
jgi:hypothetical protein